MDVTGMAETPRKASPLDVVKAVLSAFIGIRKGAAHERDAVTIKPVQVIIVGIKGMGDEWQARCQEVSR